MRFTLVLHGGEIITGELVGDGGMVSSYERALQLVRHRIAKHEPLFVETYRNNQTGGYERVELDALDVKSVLLA